MMENIEKMFEEYKFSYGVLSENVLKEEMASMAENARKKLAVYSSKESPEEGKREALRGFNNYQARYLVLAAVAAHMNKDEGLKSEYISLADRIYSL